MPNAFLPLFLPVLLAATSPSPDLGRIRIVSAEELAALLPTVSVVDARSAEAFEKGRIPGSVRADWRDFTKEKAGAVNLVLGNSADWGKVAPADAKLETRLRAFGLSNKKPIAVVGEPNGWGEDGRTAWNLLYWGADEVLLLDGGFRAWAASPARPVETSPPSAKPPGDFKLRLREARRIEKPAVLAAVTAKSRPLLDARTPAEYAGKTVTGQRRGGHIPGARLVPHQSLYRADGRFVGADELKKLLARPLDAAGPAPITYCTGGVRAALLALLVEARLGVVASNYDGSMWDWSADEAAPVETGSAP